MARDGHVPLVPMCGVFWGRADPVCCCCTSHFIDHGERDGANAGRRKGPLQLLVRDHRQLGHCQAELGRHLQGQVLTRSAQDTRRGKRNLKQSKNQCSHNLGLVAYTGELQSVDGYMNIALEKTDEYVNGTKRRAYGDAFVRGNNGQSHLVRTVATRPGREFLSTDSTVLGSHVHLGRLRRTTCITGPARRLGHAHRHVACRGFARPHVVWLARHVYVHTYMDGHPNQTISRPVPYRRPSAWPWLTSSSSTPSTSGRARRPPPAHSSPRRPSARPPGRSPRPPRAARPA